MVLDDMRRTAFTTDVYGDVLRRDRPKELRWSEISRLTRDQNKPVFLIPLSL